MSLTPLNLNALSGLLQNTGLTINADAASYMGTSTGLGNYDPGTLVSGTVLNNLSKSISAAFAKGVGVYNSLITIGSGSIPVLGNTPPNSYTGTYSGQLTSYGFLRLFPLQAYNEFHINNGSYSDFLNTFNTCYSSMTQSNNAIQSYIDSSTYLDGTYSNMDDLITGDITSVSTSTLFWGQDLVASGRAIDLSTISTFGNPENLLRTIKQNQAMTQAVNLALLASGLTTSDVLNIISGQTPSTQQQIYIYNAFNLILGQDLKDVLVPLNCQTPNLNSLADLLDPSKLFPNSYQTLTVPVYNLGQLATNSKAQYLIYVGTGVNTSSALNYGARLAGILPRSIAFAADAFGTSMMQIKQIQSVSIEKFAQVVTNLENVTGLGVNGTSVPTDQASASVVLGIIAKGSGYKGLYQMTDYFGSMTNLRYQWSLLQSLIQSLQTSTLATIYSNMYSLITGPSMSYSDSALTTLIGQANTEITRIQTTNPSVSAQVNTLYSQIGQLLLIEQNARAFALPYISQLTTNTNDTNGFLDNVKIYSTQTQTNGPAQVLENISNTTTLAGNSLIGSMREERNTQRMALAGLIPDNIVQQTPLTLPPPTGATVAQIMTDKGSASGSSQAALGLPVTVLPNNQNNLPAPDSNNVAPNPALLSLPIVTGAPTALGSLAGNPYTTLIPDNLSVLNVLSLPSLMTPSQAVAHITVCNCDCWKM